MSEAPQDVEKAKNRTLQQDHAVLQEMFEKVMNGEDVKAMFQVSHNEKFLQLEDIEDNKEDWKLELEHLERILASIVKSVTRVYWKNPELL